MAQQNINVGAAPNDTSGDTLRDAFVKVNTNFTEVFSKIFEQATTTTTSTAQTVLAGFSTATYSSAKFLIQASQGSVRHVTEFLVVHDGVTAIATEYGTLITSVALFNLEVDVSGGAVRVLVTPTSATSTVFKTNYTLIGV